MTDYDKMWEDSEYHFIYAFLMSDNFKNYSKEDLAQVIYDRGEGILKNRSNGSIKKSIEFCEEEIRNGKVKLPHIMRYVAEDKPPT